MFFPKIYRLLTHTTCPSPHHIILPQSPLLFYVIVAYFTDIKDSRIFGFYRNAITYIT